MSGRPAWPSRDPIEESGGINTYEFVANNPILWTDVLGWLIVDSDRRIIFVDKCEVVVLLGHGSQSNPWKWKVKNGCNAATAITCWPINNSQGIPDAKDLWQNKPSDDPELEPGKPGTYGADPNDPSRTFTGKQLYSDPVFDKVYIEANHVAHSLCKKNCGCKTIKVKFIYHPRNANYVIYSPNNKQVGYDGVFTIKDYEWDCESNTRR